MLSCFIVLLRIFYERTCSFEHRQQNPGAWEVQIWFITIPRKLGSIIPYIYNKWPRCWSLLNAGCFENYPLALFTQLLHLLLAYPTHQLKKQQDHQHTKITKGLALQVFLGEPLAVFSHAELRPDCVTVTWGLGVNLIIIMSPPSHLQPSIHGGLSCFAKEPANKKPFQSTWSVPNIKITPVVGYVRWVFLNTPRNKFDQKGHLRHNLHWTP